MAHEKTWQYTLNVQMGDVSALNNQCGWFLWWKKQFLTGGVAMNDQNLASIASPTGLWTVAGSGDGTTGAMDGVDRLGGSTFDATKWVFSTTTSGARSWIVYYNASLGVWLTIDCQGTSAAYCHLYLAWVAPTGGSATARPTSTNEADGGTLGTNATGRQFFDTVTMAARKVHGILATDGSFFVLSSKDGGGLFNTIFSCHLLGDTMATDSYPQLAGWEFNATAGVWRGTSPFGGSSNAFAGRDGTGSTTFFGEVPFVAGSAFIAGVGSSPRTDGKYRSQKLYFSCNASNRYNDKGRGQDWILTQALSDGTLNPGTGNPTDMQVGYCMIPTNAAPLL